MASDPSKSPLFDVAIVGAGFAGAALCATLARRGCRVVLCDPHDIHPADFRAEKLSPDQADCLQRLGLAGPLLGAATAVGALRIARRGVIVDERPVREYSLDYARMVATLRDEVPGACWLRKRVDNVEAVGERQRVTLSDGSRFEARLVVLATGLGMALPKRLGLEQIMLSERHSLAIGFDMALEGPRGPSLTYHSERVADRCGYLTLFPIGERMRANLFVYRRHDEEWSRAFRADPRESLLRLMPGIARMLPPFSIPTAPVLRPINLTACASPLRGGLVLIGDAFFTTCPAGGGGIGKALTDVERLATLAPRWLAEGGAIGVDRIAQFYDDPVKRASDRRARWASQYSKAISIDPSLAWSLRRARNFHGLRLRSWLRRKPRGAPSAALVNKPQPFM
jgi:2-polyprenyl-6-methoxyphenol hydroxylase-like FAD-dependent oxidoreductase